ncbi:MULTISPECIES: TfoX/Sxy family DNA transformation protein [Basfia]|uniref:TfoX protein n=2 Tax=Basfia TaxID=697331 RepID=Q65Q52_MANSM|nr:MULTISPECIES: TfoX/Sxy family DNA transformation protein [Basfia]AAU38908.1 TfoX protein [[Mannheimia] succiniciproducens MBEL55E]QIM69410.1 hypothetical protein A4G13_08405 [Basfia succiniciproducens]SCY11947.1 regulator of competence-specific genes [Basfia succiniciproducens]
MNRTNKDTQWIRTILNSFLENEVTAKHLFVGYGLFYRKVMFGIVIDDNFFLKAENQLVEYVEKLGAVSWDIFNKNTNLAISSYYRLPRALVDNEEEFKTLVILSIKQQQRKILDLNIAKKERIKELPNLSIKHERLLAKIGINNVKEFKSAGISNCFVKLKVHGFSVNVELFWLFQAALKNKHVSLLTKSEKKSALLVLNRKLVEAGFREIKHECLI